jgi:hypothetical protein
MLIVLQGRGVTLRWVMVRGSGVKRLQRLGMVSSVPGMSALDMNSAEDAVVRNTREVVPGMVICGMEACRRPCTLQHPAMLPPCLQSQCCGVRKPSAAG